MDNEKSVVQEVRERNYNPFAQNVNEKPYSKAQVGVSPEQISQPIPEPTYQPQQLGGTNPYDNLNGESSFSGGGGGGKSSDGQKPINPSMGDLPPHERKQAAEHLADLAISGYEMLHVFGNKALQISNSKIKKLVAKEIIDLNINIPFGTGTITAEQFIQQYNEEVSDALSVSNKFKKDVRPPLVRVLEKRGLGATDEQQLFTIVIMDLVTKGGVIYQALSTQKEMIKVIQERTEFEKQNGYGSVPYQEQPTPKKPTDAPVTPKANTTRFTGEADLNAEDFNFRTNETVMNASVQQMKVPNTGKVRSMAQRQKEKVWEANANKANGSYEQAIQSRKAGSGKRGRPKKSEINTQSIADAIIIKETKNNESDINENMID
jgi:hypothetical protein